MRWATFRAIKKNSSGHPAFIRVYFLTQLLTLGDEFQAQEEKKVFTLLFFPEDKHFLNIEKKKKTLFEHWPPSPQKSDSCPPLPLSVSFVFFAKLYHNRRISFIDTPLQGDQMSL
jgi:hypothetical protein